MVVRYPYSGSLSQLPLKISSGTARNLSLLAQHHHSTPPSQPSTFSQKATPLRSASSSSNCHRVVLLLVRLPTMASSQQNVIRR